MDLREKLIKLRKEKEYTQEKLSKALGISISTIKNYESEKISRTPDISVLKIYSEFFDVSLDYLLNDSIINKTPENINIGKILKLSDTAISNLKTQNHQAINLLLESNYLTEINELLDLYIKCSNILNKVKSINIENIDIYDTANKVKDIIDTHNSYYKDNRQIFMYTYSLDNMENVYLDIIENNLNEYSSKKNLEIELKDEVLIVSTTFYNAVKTIKLELLEKIFAFLEKNNKMSN